MADHPVVNDVSTQNSCCNEWRAKYSKLQQKYKKIEDGRAALRQGIKIFEEQLSLVQAENMKLREASEEKLQTENERKDKVKEAAARVSLENEVSALKSEILVLSQRAGSEPEHTGEELTHLQDSICESEKQIKSLQEQLQKEVSVADVERTKAVQEKKRADEAWESAKTEKSRASEELEHLRARLHSEEVEKNQLKKNLQNERERADLEKQRADEAVKAAKMEKARADAIEAEKKDKENKREIERVSLENELSSLLSQQKVDSGVQKMDLVIDHQARICKMESEISRLKELADKERIRADSEIKKAESERKKANEKLEILKAEKAAEQKRLIDAERKKAEENGHRLEMLKSVADEARSKLVLETKKSKEANRKLEAERHKVIIEKKKAEEQQKIAEISTKNVLEEKHRADCLYQQLEEYQRKYNKLKEELEEKSRSDKLAQQLEDAKHGTSNLSDEIQGHVSSRNSADPRGNPTDVKAKSTEMKLLKKELKLEKMRVRHAKKVAELEKDRKKVLKAELQRLKLEFAQFSNRIGICICSADCNVGKFDMGKNRIISSKREFTPTEVNPSLQIKKELLKSNCAAMNASECFKQSMNGTAPSFPISGNCTESTSGIASKMEPLIGGSNSKIFRSSAIDSSMASFSDRQLVGSQGRGCFSNSKSAERAKENSHLQLPISRLSGEVNRTGCNENIAVVADNNVKSPPRVRSKVGHMKKRKRLLNAIGSIENLYSEGKKWHTKVAENISTLNGILGHVDKLWEKGKYSECYQCHKRRNISEDLSMQPCNLTEKQPVGEADGGNDLEILEGTFDGDVMKLLNLEDAVEEECYRAAVQRPLSPTLPEIDSESTLVDCCQYCVVFPDISGKNSLSKIFSTTRTVISQCCMFLEMGYACRNLLSALSAVEDLLPKEKVCIFFSVFLSSFSGSALTNLNCVSNSNFCNFIDIFSGKIREAMSDLETRSMFAEVCDLDEFITLVGNFIIDGRVLVYNNMGSETLPLSDPKDNMLFDGTSIPLTFEKASTHQLLFGAILLASFCAACDRIDLVCEVSYTVCLKMMTDLSMRTFLLVFAYICGEKFFALDDYSLIMTVMKSLVTFCDRDDLSSGFPSFTKSQFSEGAIPMEELASLLLERLRSYALCNLCKGGVIACFIHKIKAFAYESKAIPDDAVCYLGDVLSLLELLASNMSWGWTCENIVGQLLKLLEGCVTETSLTAILVLLGQMARLGVDANGFQDTEVENMRVKLCSFLSCSASSKFGLPVQFAAVNALLVMTPFSFRELAVSSKELPTVASLSPSADCIRKWFSLLSDEHKSLSLTVLTVGLP